MSEPVETLTRLHASLSTTEKNRRRCVQEQLDRLLASRSEGELQVLQLRVLVAVRQNRQLMALSDAISEALLEEDLPTEHPCWERSKFLSETVTLKVVRSFVATLRPATRSQRLLAQKLLVSLPAKCSSIEAAHQVRTTLHLRRLGREESDHR